MFLVGDIGGTKTILATYERSGEQLELLREATFPSGAFGTLEEIIARYLGEQPGETFDVCCFGVAGPVRQGRCKTTNLPWELDEVALAKSCRAGRGKLLNDLEAAAYGMLFVAEKDFVTLQVGQPVPGGNVAVIAAGTGLGEALLVWDGARYHPVASEGGHCGFAPRNELEIGLLQFLQKRYGSHVSCERILSGQGFYDVYCYLRDSHQYPETADVAARLLAGSPQPVITQLGLAGSDPLCQATVELFCEIYGAEAGNLALKCLSLGGVFIGGGIGPKLESALRGPGFLRGFHDKGRFRELMESLPIRMSRDGRGPLLGAAHYALRYV